MSRTAAFVVGTLVTTGATVGALAYFKRRSLAGGGGAAPALPTNEDDPAQTPQPTPGLASIPDLPPEPSALPPIIWDNLLPLPTAAEVTGDLDRNWGSTPIDLRPLFALIEEASRIEGAGRLLSVASFRESAWKADAQNGDAPGEEAERYDSWRAYYNGRSRNPPLKYGEAAANFGSGGLFGSLAPYGLWTGVQEMKGKAPLLNSDPRILLIPRVAGFVASVYLQRLLAHYDIRDHGDIKVGWRRIGLLSEEGRKGAEYRHAHDRFYEDAKKVGIDLSDVTTIPPRLSASRWPGVAQVFDKLVVKLPTARGVA